MGEQGPAGRDQRLPREATVRRLMGLDGESRLTTGHVQLAAEGLGVSERTVWRWIEAGRARGELDQRPRGHFEVTDQVRERLAFWRGNVAAVHRELVEAAKGGGPAAPSRQTLQRAVGRDVLRGNRAACAAVNSPAGRTMCSCSDLGGTATRCGKPTMLRPRSRSTSRAACSSRG